MQDLPDKISLLEAVARFLGDERLKKEIRDPALAFRVKIAAHVIESVAREEAAEDRHDAAELQRLEELFELPRSSSEISKNTRRARIAELNRMLAKRLRTGGASELDPFVRRAHAHLKTTL